ncbi:MAG: hypothetical protein FNNCIFGK_01019 [Bacteroidia bacterium]|nr:hypothetical protein [Bacteroidia bacterium]
MRNIDFNLIACLSREYSCLLIMLIFEINIVLLRIFMSYVPLSGQLTNCFRQIRKRVFIYVVFVIITHCNTSKLTYIPA